MAAYDEKEELYEIAPVESYSTISHEGEELEREIDEIKRALRGAAGFAKIESEAQAVVTRMLDMIKTLQTLVEQISHSNQQLAAKIQEALDKIVGTNAALSEKLGTILDSLAEEGGGETEEGRLFKDISNSINNMVEQNSRILQTLESIEKYLKRTAVRAQPLLPLMPPPRQAFSRPTVPAQATARGKQDVAIPPGFEEELPPPPFPP